MAELAVTELRAHIETDLTDVALQRLLDAAIADVGPESDVPEYTTGLGRRYIFLSRPASAIVSAVEHVESADLTLAISDYRILGGSQIERLTTGTNPAYFWNERVTITYTPSDLAKRAQALIDLVRLEVERRAVTSEGIGDYQMSAPEYEAERTRIVSAFRGRSMA